MKFLVNDGIVNFTHDDFPMLISGADKTGSSFFSISLMTDLYKKGEKVLLFSALPQAKDLFKEQVGDNLNKNAIIIESGNENFFLNKLNEIQDLLERIILSKNIEEYSINLFNKLKDKKLVIFSGDVDRCEFVDELIKNDFKTKIFFSYPEKIQIENKIDLPKYTGFIISDSHNGLIKVEK